MIIGTMIDVEVVNCSKLLPTWTGKKKTQDVVDFGILGTKESIGKNKGTEMSILAQSCSLGCSVIITQLISILVSSEDATLCE